MSEDLPVTDQALLPPAGDASELSIDKPLLDGTALPPVTGQVDPSQLVTVVADPTEQTQLNNALETPSIFDNPYKISQRWTYSEDGHLQPTTKGSFDFNVQARELLEHPEQADEEITAAIASATEGILQEFRARKQNRLEYFKNAQAADETGRQYIEEGIQKTLSIPDPDPATLRLDPRVITVVKETLTEKDKQLIEQTISDRIEADKLPWTMPNPKVSPEILEIFKGWCEIIVEQSSEPRAQDSYWVPAPSSGEYDEKDQALLARIGIEPQSRRQFTRAELQQAGVFFLNRVGEGEQPIFGVPIPDPQSEGGVFNVQNRSFLTREEFDKVYRYQQEHGYGIGERDPKDVQRDMVMYGLRPEYRNDWVGMKAGGQGRENKFRTARSPFVDSGFYVKDSGFGALVSAKFFAGEHKSRRMNTLSVHLINGHPDYPGLSEMADDNATWDQHYLTAAEFIDHFYVPLPTPQEVLVDLQQGWPTQRERAWVGSLPDHSE